jgi:hypothetical protein
MILFFTDTDAPVVWLFYEFFDDVYNQYKSFIWLDLMVKNREVTIERYFKWWTSIKLV